MAGGRAWASRTRGRTMTNADRKTAIRERMAFPVNVLKF
jgi:hypothetical protein